MVRLTSHLTMLYQSRRPAVGARDSDLVLLLPDRTRPEHVDRCRLLARICARSCSPVIHAAGAPGALSGAEDALAGLRDCIVRIAPLQAHQTIGMEAFGADLHHYSIARNTGHSCKSATRSPTWVASIGHSRCHDHLYTKFNERVQRRSAMRPSTSNLKVWRAGIPACAPSPSHRSK